MQTATMTNTARLTELLVEALALADTLQIPLAAIHIDQALGQIAATDTED